MADYSHLWRAVLEPSGATQQEMAKSTGLKQPRISERLNGVTGSEAERWAVAVAAAALMGMSESKRSRVVKRARDIKSLADKA